MKSVSSNSYEPGKNPLCVPHVLGQSLKRDALFVFCNKKRDKVKILVPLFNVKHKTGLNYESISMFNAALAIRI